MNNTDRERLLAVFADACDLLPEQQQSFVRDAFAGEPGMLAETLELLAADRLQSPLDTPAAMPCPSSSAAAAELPCIDRFQLIEAIASGGMGTVYRAEQLQPVQRTVALKVLRPGLAEGRFLTRFAAERQVVARLVHTGIAQLYDSGVTDDGCPFFAMELVDGEPIASFCDARALDLPSRVRLVANVCDAVHYAHEQGIVHRDLKPANVLATMQDGRPLAKVIDFGIAHSRSDDAQHGEAILGTAGYLSPERLEGSAGGVPADVFALGVLLGEVLVGQVVAAGSRSPCSALLRAPGFDADRLANLRSVAAARFARECRRDLDWIVARAVATEPQQRYASAKELAEDLRRYLGALPVAARSHGIAYVGQRLWVRRRAAMVAATVALVAVVVAAKVSQFGWLEARQSHDSVDAASKLLVERGSDGDLARLPGGDRTRIEMVRAGLELSELALQQRPDDEDLQDRAFRARRAWAKLMIELGRLPEAEVALRRSLATDVAGVDRRARASARVSLIAALRGQGKLAAANEDAQGLLQELQKHGGHEWSERALMSAAFREQCLNERRLGNQDAALAAARNALECVRQEPESKHRAWYLWNSIDCYKMLGEQTARLSEGDYAACFATAVARLEDLMHDSGRVEDPAMRFQLALLFGSWSYADAKRENLPQIQEHLRQALAILEPLTTNFPDRVPYQDAWMRVRERMVYLRERLGDSDAALELLRESVSRGDAWLKKAPKHEKLAWRVQQAKDMLASRR